MFAMQARFISPSLIGVTVSVELVVLAAVGGRFSLLGAGFGVIAIKTVEMFLSQAFPELWTILMGLVLIAVVLVFPEGLAGLYRVAKEQITQRSATRSTAVMAGPDATSEGPDNA